MSDATSQSAVANEKGYSKKNPFPSTLKQRRLLNKVGSTKEVQHLEMCLAGSGLEYRPGDSLAIFPTNSDRQVDDVIEAGGLDTGALVESTRGASVPLGQALKHELDISGLTKSVLKKYNHFARSDKIDSLLAPENAAGLKEYLWGREVIDLLVDYPVPGLAADDFCGTLRKLSPRLYSIASSPLATSRGGAPDNRCAALSQSRPRPRGCLFHLRGQAG